MHLKPTCVVSVPSHELDGTIEICLRDFSRKGWLTIFEHRLLQSQRPNRDVTLPILDVIRRILMFGVICMEVIPADFAFIWFPLIIIFSPCRTFFLIPILEDRHEFEHLELNEFAFRTAPI